MEEFSLYLENMDLDVAGFRCGQPDGPKLLALHGWLDNAASHSLIAPFFDSYDFYAIDFPGHGKSSHLSKSQAYQIFDYIRFVLSFIKQMNWESVYLLGHSLGGGVALLTTALLQDCVKGLCLIESLGPLTKAPDNCAQQLYQYMQQCLNKTQSKPKLYSSIIEAAKVRSAHSNVNQFCAEVLAKRGTVEIDGFYTWSSDPRLRLASPQPLTEDQLASFLRMIKTKIFVLTAEQGWSLEEQLIKSRMSLLTNISKICLPGSHHLHMEHPQESAEAILKNGIFSPS